MQLVIELSNLMVRNYSSIFDSGYDDYEIDEKIIKKSHFLIVQYKLDNLFEILIGVTLHRKHSFDLC